MTIGLSANGLKVWFEWDVLVLFPGRIKGVRHISEVLTNFETIDSASADARPHVPRFFFFKSNQFSFVPKRKRKHFPPRRSLLVTAAPVLFLSRIFRPNRGEGICFEFMLWIFDEFLQSCFVHMRGVFTGFCSNFYWMVAGWFGFLVPFGRTEAGRKKRGAVRLLDVGNNFSYNARSGTSFQWWTRRRWLCENLKYANSV